MKMIDCICGGEISPARFALGYRVCLKCGEAKAKERKFTVVPMHKSNYIALFNKNDLQGINNKGGLIK